MNTRNRLFTRITQAALLGACVLGIAISTTSALAASPNAAPSLDLANRPLLTGSGVKPNVMVAVDNSGSMDFEVLFPTQDGQLFWDGSTQSFYHNGQYNSPGYYEYYGNYYYRAAYAYLFPNGCNNGQNLGKRIYCDNYGRYAVPPIPKFAFARSPDYNKSYFNPADTYTSWPRHDDAWLINKGGLTAIPFNPEGNSVGNTIDLTMTREKRGRGENFVFEPGMIIPVGTNYYHSGDGHGLNTGFISDKNPVEVYQTSLYAVSYFPATFYIKSKLAATYGYTAPTPSSKAPDGNNLFRYEIKPGNFSDTAHYTAAIHNFANWFTYYRKRNLAVRGGIVSAFDRISGVRAGSCTINNPQPLNMLNIDTPAGRTQFYNDIFGIDFYQALGTPNRQAVDFLGQQLETNSDIIQSPCQKNYAILFTDGYNSGQPNSFGHNGNSSGDLDGDGHRNTMADIALHYYNNLGKLQFPNNINRDQMTTPPACDAPNPPKSLDCENDLHMNLYGVTLGQSGTVYNGSGNNPNPYTNPPDWSSINSNNLSSPTQIDDLWHATVNSHGALLNAQTPQGIADQFAGALENILNAPGSASSIGANSGNVTDNSVIYNASYVSGVWSGDLSAYRLANGTQQSDAPLWKASTQFNQGASNYTSPNNRVILTSVEKNNRYQPEPFEPATFQSSSSSVLPGFLLGALGGGTQTSNDNKVAAVVNYIRGDRSKEQGQPNGTFRYRATNILGDIVHSTPMYVGAPNRTRYPQHWTDQLYPNATMVENESDVGPYNKPGSTTAFAQKNANREPMVYVGANDGMLHGFDAQADTSQGGKEKIAYVPGSIVPNLADLTQPNYNHRFYVDGSPNVGDAVFDHKWHTVLVSGLGNGGRSVFALDITHPADFSESDPSKTFLWEYTDTGLGKTFGKPSIVRLHDGKWAAIFGNGYNSDSGDVALYVVNLATGALIKRIEPDPQAYPGLSQPTNGLSAPFPVDLDGDFITDYVYAGDLHGNLWKFDLTSDNPDDWSATRVFTATDANGDPQPITTQPQVGIHPYGKDYGVMVYFGTGKYIENGDAAKNTSLLNSFYGIWDLDVFTFNKANNGSPLFTASLTSDIPKDRLTQQSIITTVNKGGSTYRVVSQNPVNYQQSATSSGTKNKRGWYIDLPANTGEIINSNAQLQGNDIAFSTLIPNQQACVAGGSGYFMIVSAATGGRTNTPAFDLNNDHTYNSDDKVSYGDNGKDSASVSGKLITRGAPNKALFSSDPSHNDSLVTLPASDGGFTQINVNTGKSNGRLSWREIRR
jgi:type IV pilus assembly protein PilY1